MPITPDKVSPSLSTVQNTGNVSSASDGVKVTYIFPHGLPFVPMHATITPKNLTSIGDKWLTYDTTNITVNFTSAPLLGTVQFSWAAFK